MRTIFVPLALILIVVKLMLIKHYHEDWFVKYSPTAFLHMASCNALNGQTAIEPVAEVFEVCQRCAATSCRRIECSEVEPERMSNVYALSHANSDYYWRCQIKVADNIYFTELSYVW